MPKGAVRGCLFRCEVRPCTETWHTPRIGRIFGLSPMCDGTVIKEAACPQSVTFRHGGSREVHAQRWIRNRTVNLLEAPDASGPPLHRLSRTDQYLPQFQFHALSKNIPHSLRETNRSPSAHIYICKIKKSVLLDADKRTKK